MGHTNNFSPVGEADLNAMSDCCCITCGSKIDGGHLDIMILIDENNVRGGSSLMLKKAEPTDFRNGKAEAATGGSPPQAEEMER